MGQFMAKALAIALAATAAACAPTLTQRGYAPESEDFAAKVEPGVDTMETVTAKLGSPSTTGAFEDAVWYYVTEVQSTRAFFDPKVTTRQVVAVRFDANEKVASVDTFGVERGRVVSINGEETPTRGRELGVLEQLFGNVGRSPAQIGAEEQGRENRR